MDVTKTYNIYKVWGLFGGRFGPSGPEIGFPGRISGFRAGFRPDFGRISGDTLRNSASGPEIGFPGPDSSRGGLEIGPPAGLRPAGGPILRRSRLESDRNLAPKPTDTWPPVIGYP